MVAQSLYALALDHLSDYATLKAIGAEDRQVYRIIALQSLAVATGGSIIGMSIVFVIRRFWDSPIAPLVIPPEVQIAAIVLVMLICVASSVLPFRRLRRVDPAVVLQG
jgi:putative ABC transport system permease protein